MLLGNIKYYLLDTIILAIRTIIDQKCSTTGYCPTIGHALIKANGILDLWVNVSFNVGVWVNVSFSVYFLLPFIAISIA